MRQLFCFKGFYAFEAFALSNAFNAYISDLCFIRTRVSTYKGS